MRRIQLIGRTTCCSVSTIQSLQCFHYSSPGTCVHVNEFALSQDVIRRLCCMHTSSVLQRASQETTDLVNQAIQTGQLRDKLGRTVSEPIDGGLVNAEHTVLYPIVNGVVQMLRDELIELEPLQVKES